MTNRAADITANLAGIRDRIAEAAKRSGRPATAITLIGVTKYVDAETAAALVEAGCRDLGESRPQELARKAESLRELPIDWHLIGHLQRNKVKLVLPLVRWVHSCDSRRLLAAINDAARSTSRRVPLLLEVNISGDANKHGFSPGDIEAVLSDVREYPHVEVRGLMTMASLHGGSDTARRDFSNLRELRDAARSGCPPEASLDELSMGMSRDYELAIEEGATMVRVGSALFADR